MTTKFGFLATLGVGVALMLAPAGAALAQARDAGELHAALHLTLEQEPSWRAYQRALQPDPVSNARHQSAQMMMAGLTTPRRIDLIEANMQADLEVMHRQGEATKAFYRIVDPRAAGAVFDRETLPQPGGAMTRTSSILNPSRSCGSQGDQLLPKRHTATASSPQQRLHDSDASPT